MAKSASQNKATKASKAEGFTAQINTRCSPSTASSIEALAMRRGVGKSVVAREAMEATALLSELLALRYSSEARASIDGQRGDGAADKFVMAAEVALAGVFADLFGLNLPSGLAESLIDKLTPLIGFPLDLAADV